MRLQASLDSASIAVKSHSVISLFTKPVPVQNVVFDLRSGRSSLSVREFTSNSMLSVLRGAGSGACALRGTLATCLVNLADASLSVGLLALRSHLLLIFYRSYFLVAALARRNSRDPTLSVLRSLPSFTGRARGGLDRAGDVSLRCR